MLKIWFSFYFVGLQVIKFIHIEFKNTGICLKFYQVAKTPKFTESVSYNWANRLIKQRNLTMQLPTSKTKGSNLVLYAS